MSTDTPAIHLPVMIEEVMSYLQPERGGAYWDLTLGAGGHMGIYIDRAPEGTQCYGLDGDPAALVRAAHLPAELHHGNLHGGGS